MGNYRLFSGERRRLFSTPSTPYRRKLFSSEGVEYKEGSQTLRSMVCQDCGFKLESAGSPTGVLCPKCGGTRFNVEISVFSPEGTPEPVPSQKIAEEKTYSLFSDNEEGFQKSFSETSDPFELKLKAYSGQKFSKDKFEKTFSEMTAGEFAERSFGEIESDGSVSISPTAFLQSRLFSKLIISVTKVLDLDPELTSPYCDKAKVIDRLEQEGDICPKGIIMIKKAHNIPLCPVHGDHEDWMRDSGILGDLKLEFGGTSKPLPEFQRTLESRYPDAPVNLLELLRGKGVARVDGGTIHILK